jgi:acyl-CoA reductase-like NAD-dependent aldehyde dehydrogenase
VSDFGMTIDGKTVKSGATFEVINPSTGSAFAEAPDCTADELNAAMSAAEAAFPAWRADETLRRELLHAAADALEKSAAELAPILTAEQGKPLANSIGEIGLSALWLRYYADLEIAPEVIQDDAQGYAELHRRALGVVGAITPWNFPVSLAVWKIAPALRAGNTMVLKPSPYTPVTTLAVGEALQQVLPPGVLNVVSGRDPLGASITEHRVPRKITFTGSTATGKRVMAAAAADLKRVTLELGGNDPAIVLDDADPAAVAQRVFWSAFLNCGQICVAVKRLYVPENMYADVVDALASAAKGAHVGEGNEDGVQIGPINNKPQFDRVSQLVSQALAGGARAAAGGSPIDRAGYFYNPTILCDIDDDAAIVAEEQFGPALPVLSYRDIDEVVARANNSMYGLTASVWSGDPDRAARVGLQLDCGQVDINAHATGLTPNLPFAGVKWSGIGVENGPWGLHEFTELQVLHAPPRSPAGASS